MKKQNQDCEDCYKIRCRNCGWEPDDLEVQKVLNKELKNCPECGTPPS